MDRTPTGARPADTAPDAWRMQMRSLRAMTPQQRLEMWEAMNHELAELEDRAVRRRHPDLDDQQIMTELIAIRYGRDLAELSRAAAARHR